MQNVDEKPFYVFNYEAEGFGNNAMNPPAAPADANDHYINTSVIPNDTKPNYNEHYSNITNAPSKSSDTHQIFADFVADQLRNTTTDKQKRLKLLIQKAIISIEESPEKP